MTEEEAQKMAETIAGVARVELTRLYSLGRLDMIDKKILIPIWFVSLIVAVFVVISGWTIHASSRTKRPRPSTTARILMRLSARPPSRSRACARLGGQSRFESANGQPEPSSARSCQPTASLGTHRCRVRRPERWNSEMCAVPRNKLIFF